MTAKNEKPSKNSEVWLYAKSIALVALAISLSIRIYDTKVDISMDTPTLLSILLALFSVGLSALFYFKATDTSNKFYDNSYKYTKDIAELLVKIESGFGERLKNLDEGYSSMRDHIQNGKAFDLVIKETKSNLKAEKEDIDKIKQEKEDLLKKLFESSKLRTEEKESLAKELESKEQDLKESQREVARLNKKLFIERVEKREGSSEHLRSARRRVENHTMETVIPCLGDVEDMSIRELNEQFMSLDLYDRYLGDLERLGFYSLDTERLTRRGVAFMKKMSLSSKQNL
ncbi:coiled-coil domain-containing protein [Vibrio vulnificus]|uniref:coiled-coil domain-containing protein n=1 Tax=Vibrio vulnificus TaxID=672 RepID=UPI000CD0E554|nr:hypothetical protein [Vibrio vulnificus]EGR1894505.1 hypothetical protein [Vibrio vulnificus]EIF3178477.1 hypothetical protein [Vibrio vulnificus]POC17866.1 hypothetical protein CRN60_22500 [Vibrio vulnificus]RZR09691.1 hypothetical protein D8T44_20595 [Vibrio vulnificus]HAS8393974.1 hypothetical protein [Vibrio vulnificus]